MVVVADHPGVHPVRAQPTPLLPLVRWCDTDGRGSSSPGCPITPSDNLCTPGGLGKAVERGERFFLLAQHSSLLILARQSYLNYLK